MDEIVLIGAGGHARACIDVIECESRFKIVGPVEKDELNTENNFEYPIIGVDNDLEKLQKKYTYALITVGHIKNSGIRKKLFELLNKLNF